MLKYMPYHEYKVCCTIVCIIRPVPDVLVHSINFMLIFSFNDLELNLLRLQLHFLKYLAVFLTHIQ